MKSMTGYGRGESENGELRLTVEIKTVNNRYCEIIIKQPRQYMALEDKIKKYISAHIERGRVEVFINTKEKAEKTGEIKINFAQALAYDKALAQLSKEVGTEYQPDVYHLFNLPDVICHEDSEEDLDAIWLMLEEALKEALAQHLQMRQKEGDLICADMLQKLQNLENFAAEVEKRAPMVAENYREKLTSRLNEVLGAAELDQERLAQEVAIFGEKCCIDEELVRLKSHFTQFREIITAKGPVGRKLDFLIQEMNRETNTIGSKANDLAITSAVVEMKSELEKLREQVQNIE